MLYPFQLARADVLGGKARQAVGQGGKGGDGERVQLNGRGIPGDDGRAKGIDQALDAQVAHRDKALLQNTRYGDQADAAEHGGGEHAGPVVRGGLDAAQTPDKGKKCEKRGDPLTQKGGPGDAAHAHVERDNKKEIERDVAEGGGDEKIEGRPGIAKRGKNAGANIIEKEEEEAADVNPQIEGGIGENAGGCLQQAQERGAGWQADGREEQAEEGHGDKRGVDRRFHSAVLPRAEELGDDHRTADVGAGGHRHEDHGDGIGNADGGQRIFAYKAASDHTVHNVVKLLKDDAEKQGEGEQPELPGWGAFGHILDHANRPFLEK